MMRMMVGNVKKQIKYNPQRHTHKLLLLFINKILNTKIIITKRS